MVVDAMASQPSPVRVSPANGPGIVRIATVRGRMPRTDRVLMGHTARRRNVTLLLGALAELMDVR
jgi:hypothetical protein